MDDVLSVGSQLISGTSCADAKAGFHFSILSFIMLIRLQDSKN